MYTREHNDYHDNIPDNYGGIAIKSQCDDKRERDGRRECDDRRECERHEQKCYPKRSSGIFSSLLGKLGLDGIDTTELVLLFAALLLIGDGDNCDDDNYIWVILLLLLIIK